MITINVESVGAVDISDREDYLELLKTEGVKGLMKDGVRESYNCLVHNGTYTLGPPIDQLHGQQQQQRQGEGIERFRSLLLAQGITPIQPIMMQIIKHYAASIPLIVEPVAAADLYYTASIIPRSATEIVLREQGISVAQPFRVSDSKAVLLHAFRDGYPMILKVSTPKSIDHEISVMEKIMEDAEKNNLVVIEHVHFESATIEITDENGEISVPYARSRSGILMKHFQITLAQCKIPLTETVLLKFGNQLKRAIQHMHKNGYCHLDLKPSNVFLLEGNCYLGDYGAAKPIGQEIIECTRNYYPSDLPPLAEKKTDYLLLAKTLLEMCGEIESPVKPMSTEEILGSIQGVKTESVRDFLTSCFDGC